MERLKLRSHRHAVARASVVALMAAGALPALAAADKPAAPGNGPPGPAGNPNQGHAPRGNAHGHGQPPGHANPRPPKDRTPRPQAAAPAPAPAPSAPASAPAPAPSTTKPKPGKSGGARKTTLCHATGSDADPYVEITVSGRKAKAHARHSDRKDIVPAPAGGCPEGAAAARKASRAVTAGDLGLLAGRALAADRETRAPGRSGAPRGHSEVLGAAVTGAAAAPAAAEASEASEASKPRRNEERGSLPFTGLGLALALFTAAGLLLAGFAARRAASHHTTA